MKASELRIGNYVYDTEGNVNTINLDAIKYLLQYGSTEICQVKAIPLTDELIQKLGFERFETDGVVGINTYEPEEKTVWYEKEKYTIVQWGENTPFFFSNHALRVELKFVHQLQNLYFSLTNKELTLT